MIYFSCITTLLIPQHDTDCVSKDLIWLVTAEAHLRRFQGCEAQASSALARERAEAVERDRRPARVGLGRRGGSPSVSVLCSTPFVRDRSSRIPACSWLRRRGFSREKRGAQRHVSRDSSWRPGPLPVAPGRTRLLPPRPARSPSLPHSYSPIISETKIYIFWANLFHLS